MNINVGLLINCLLIGGCMFYIGQKYGCRKGFKEGYLACKIDIMKTATAQTVQSIEETLEFLDELLEKNKESK